MLGSCHGAHGGRYSTSVSLVEQYFDTSWKFQGNMGAFVKVVSEVNGLKGNGNVLKWTLTVAVLFIFAWLVKVTNGASYNPITDLSYACAGISQHHSLFALAVGIPAQACGAVVGAIFVKDIMPHGAQGPVLKVDMQTGMLTEGILSFTMVLVMLFVSRRGPKSNFLKTGITSITKGTLSILGTDNTGPAMNPASAFGWAYTRGQHRTKEYLCVYWLAPIEASLLAVWIFRLFVIPRQKQQKQTKKSIKRH
eukprot:Gb_36383 [translate_table: standard]